MLYVLSTVKFWFMEVFQLMCNWYKVMFSLCCRTMQRGMLSVMFYFVPRKTFVECLAETNNSNLPRTIYSLPSNYIYCCYPHGSVRAKSANCPSPCSAFCFQGINAAKRSALGIAIVGIWKHSFFFFFFFFPASEEGVLEEKWDAPKMLGSLRTKESHRAGRGI